MRGIRQAVIGISQTLVLVSILIVPSGLARAVSADPRAHLWIASVIAVSVVLVGRPRTVWAALMLGSIGPSLLALWGAARGDLAGSTQLNPLYFGGYLATIFPLAIGYRWWPVVILDGLALASTRSIGPWLGLGIGLVAWSSPRMMHVTIAIAVVGSLLLPWPSVHTPATVGVRFSAWRSAQRAIEDAPWLGGGTIEHRVRPYLDRYELGALEGPNVIVDRTHNLILDVAVRVGLIGLMMSVLCLWWWSMHATIDRWTMWSLLTAFGVSLTGIVTLALATVVSLILIMCYTSHAHETKGWTE